MQDEHRRETSDTFDLVSRVVDESERRMRPDLARITTSLEALRLDVHELKVLRSTDGEKKGDTVNTLDRHDTRISSLEKWRAYVTGAVAVLTALALTFGVMAYTALVDVSKDVATLKARAE